MGKVLIAIGSLVAIAGLLVIPPFADLLPLSFDLSPGNSHTYYRVVRTYDSSWLISAFLIVSGLAIFVAGLVVHRRRRKI